MATNKPGNLNPDASAKGSISFGGSNQAARAVGNRRAGAGAAARTAAANAPRTLQYPDNAAQRFAEIDRMFSNMGSVRRSAPTTSSAATRPIARLPEPGSVDMVKETAKQFGQTVTKGQAKAISALLRGRVAR